MLIKYFMMQMVLSYLCVLNSYEIQCPHTSHWKLRAYHDCNGISHYYCLFDENSFMYTELCRQKPDFEGPGFKVVIFGGLNGIMCGSNRYQPFVFWTNGSSDCIFEKSLCSEEGQIIVSDKLTRTDSTCRCDYTRGYSFVLQPKHITYCVPSEEDCSCYIKRCLSGHVLNSGYRCVTDSLSHNSSTTIDPYMPFKNKSTEIVLPPANTNRDHMRFVITLLAMILTLITVVLTIILLNQFFIQKTAKKTESCTEELGLQHTISNLYDETDVPQPVFKEQEIHSEYLGAGTLEDYLVTTKAYRKIFETVKKSKVTIISGPPGCGKTSMSYQAALRLQETENCSIVVISSPSELILSVNPRAKQVFIINDIVGKYSLHENSLQMWVEEAFIMKDILGLFSDTKLIVTCRSYIYRNEKFSLLRLPHIHCDMLADEMILTVEERRRICKSYASADDTRSLPDNVLMLYNCLPLIAMRYSIQDEKNINDYFMYPYDIIQTEMNELRLSSDACFIALGLLVIFNNNIDKKSIFLHDHKHSTGWNITDILDDMLQDLNFDNSLSLKAIISSLSYMENIYIKETILTFTCINTSMFSMLVRTVGRHFVPCILKHSNSEFIKEYIEVAPFSKEHGLHTIVIESKYELLYFNRMFEDINNGLNWEVFSSVQMEHEDRRLLLIDILKAEKPTFCKSTRDGTTPLHVTSLFGYHDLSDFFVENDKSMVNARDNTGKTPLHMACSRGNVSVSKLLIESNAEVNQFDANKVTPFMLACTSGKIELIKFLLTKDVDINAISSFGSSPLLDACTKNNVKVCSILLKHKAKVNCFNKNGDTPLHLACLTGFSKIVKLLINHDADINKQNVKGYTPFQLALINGHTEIADMIRNPKTKIP